MGQSNNLPLNDAAELHAMLILNRKSFTLFGEREWQTRATQAGGNTHEKSPSKRPLLRFDKTYAFAGISNQSGTLSSLKDDVVLEGMAVLQQDLTIFVDTFKELIAESGIDAMQQEQQEYIDA
eukprot:scaffold627453_cov45-Prasinocladus_malaysianus.AAC.1